MNVADEGQSVEAAHVRSPRRTHFARAALIGLGAGLCAVGFRQGLALAETSRQTLLLRLHGHPGWGWAVLPLIGLAVGCLVGWAVTRFAPETAGSGIPHLKGVLLHLRKLAPWRVIPIKFFGGILAIGSGLSLGREGPTVQIGAGVARILAGVLRAPESDIPQLLSAGAGAGLAAAFNAPLAGLVFVIEELHRDRPAGRPRKYRSNAERQAAYRRRITERQSALLEELRRQLADSTAEWEDLMMQLEEQSAHS